MLLHEPLVHLLVIVVISLVATLVLFKWLHSQAFVKKKEKSSGLTVVLTGGAAAAVVFGVLLFMGDQELCDRFYKEPPPGVDYALRTVRGRVRLSDGTTSNKGVLFTVEPPIQTIQPDGQFLVQGVPVLPKQTTRINVTKAGYDPTPVVLTKANIERDPTEDDTNAYVLRSEVVLIKSEEPASTPVPGEVYNPDLGESPTPVR